MANTEKIFIDSDEEIVFIYEKLLNAHNKRIILIVPANSALLSSVVSLKLLVRQSLKIDKFNVIVTEDESGIKLAEKAGLVAVKKISEVTNDLWKRAIELKERQVLDKKHIKEELLAERIPEVEDKSNKPVKAKVEEDFSNIYKRLDSKIVRLKGITLVAGGDITDDLALCEEEKDRLKSEPDIEGIQTEAIIPPKAVFSNLNKNLSELENEKNIIEDEQLKESVFRTGEDVTKAMQSNSNEPIQQSDSTSSVISGLKASISRIAKSFGNKRILQVFLVGLILFFLVSYFVFPFVNVKLIFAESEVRSSGEVKAEIGLAEIVFDELKIPANKLSKTSSIEKSGDATGTAESGEKAQGEVRITNKSDEAITLSAGTVLTNIATDLEYVLKSQAVILANFDLDQVPVEASSFGENYNINGSATFVVKGYNTDSLVADSLRSISGGTTKQITVVSQEDINAVKTSAQEELKTELLASLDGLISAEDKLLDGSQTFTDDEEIISVEAGDEVLDFTVQLRMTLSAVTVLNKDLNEIAQEIIRNNENSTSEASINVENYQLTNINISDSGATFDLTFRAGVTADIGEEEVKNAIAGKPVSDVREYLRTIDGVSESFLHYTPIYIPFFLQRVPDDFSKIVIEKDFKPLSE